MVMQFRRPASGMRRGYVAGVVLVATLVGMPAALASVVATVDRGEVELNESFTLKVTVDTSIDVEPDVSALEESFYVGNRSQLSNTTIINGQISRSRTWTYVLMAKQPGEAVIPPVVVGNEKSDAVPILIKPPSSAAPGEADIFVTAEVDSTDSYVQGQILYRLKVYRAVATRQPRLSEPEISGVEVLVEVAGEERSYDALLNGKSYNVVERVYALFPQESGELSVAPAMFEARVLRDGRITGRKVFQSDPVNVTVKPIPPPPADFPNAAWLPARSVELSEEWSRAPDELPAGEPITRRLTITALGQLSTQIPVLEPAHLDAIKVYPDKPELNVSSVSGGILAKRQDQYAIIGANAGKVTLPAVQLPWWNIGTGAWEVASLPERTLTILPPAHAPAPPPEPQAQSAAPVGETIVVQSRLWQHISEGLGVAWLLTVSAWWWSRRPRRGVAAEPPPVPLHKRQARCLKEARRAATAGDAPGVKAALLEWGQLQWPEDAPRSVGALAARVKAPLSAELERLSASRYGRDGAARWDGKALAAALRTVGIRDEDAARAGDDGLPPLLPASRG